MAPSNPQLNVSLAPAAIFTNRGFRNAETYSKFLRSFRDRVLHPTFLIPPTIFNRYRLRVNGYLHDLEWSSLLKNQLLDQCPEVVRMFYASMQCGPGRTPSYFTTTVYNFNVTVTKDMLANLLHLPHDGYIAGSIEEFNSYGFHPIDTMSYLSRDSGKYQSSMFSIERLPDDLKALQFYITHMFLPREAETTTTLEESDLWIMFNARTGCRISYASLMFNHMIKYREEDCGGKLPFGPQITTLLALVGVDLRDKLTSRDVHSDLQAQHVLRRTLSGLGPRKLAKVQGGDKAAKAGTDSAEEEHEVEEEAWMKGKTAELAAAEISSLDKGKGVVEWSAKRKKSRSMDHVQEGLRLEKEGKSLIRDFTLVLKGKEASSSSKRVNRVLFVPLEDEEVDPSEYASSPEYTY
ncbi:unnamed protein product [Linum trigynum]|uniref:Uncharacterized protein n=1 Tax=Linum trigynum TaxID=586398 RepID=A0AAV2EUA5_9ROSI